MSETPANILSMNLENAKTVLANVTAFQTWVGEATAAGAKNHIYLVGYGRKTRAELIAMRPCALISQTYDASSLVHTKYAGGAVNWFAPKGAVYIQFEDNVAAEYAGANREDHYDDAEIAFTNDIGAIWEGLEALAGSDAYLSISGISVMQGPGRAEESLIAKCGDFSAIILRLDWGG